MSSAGTDRGIAAPPCQADPPAAGSNAPITDDRLQNAYAYWLQKAMRRGLPRRADIDPGEIPKLLPHIMLVEVCPEGRYRYRLIGTANADAHGVNATGRYLDEVLPGPEYRSHVLRLYDECVRTRRPLYSEALFLSAQRRVAERHTKVLFLPLADDGISVNLVMVLQVFFYIDQNTRRRHFLEAVPHKEIAHLLLPGAAEDGAVQ